MFHIMKRDFGKSETITQMNRLAELLPGFDFHDEE